MNFDLTLFSAGAIQKQATDAVLRCNLISEHFGLTLMPQDAVALVECRSRALQRTGRLELGGGILEKLIRAFCDSPFLSQQTYADTLSALTETFYAYKNETMDHVSDDELISYMKWAFDGVCQGSLALLSGRELAAYAHRIRSGLKPKSVPNAFSHLAGDDLCPDARQRPEPVDWDAVDDFSDEAEEEDLDD